MTAPIKRIRTSTLDIAYEESGSPGGVPVFLMHGWPYDPRCYDEVIPQLVAGCRVIVPYLRGFGATRFLSPDTPRSGQQGALGNDLHELMDALSIERAVLAGYDWGGRAACVAAALWPERVRALVTVNGYMIQDIAGSGKPQSPEQERRFWYHWYFQTERGRAGLEVNRRALCRLLCELWSPRWAFADATFERSAVSFDNPDFVAVTIQSYRHRTVMRRAIRRSTRSSKSRRSRFPQSRFRARRMASFRPPLRKHAGFFTGPYERRLLPGIGHNPPQEAPQVFADAILELIGAAKS